MLESIEKYYYSRGENSMKVKKAFALVSTLVMLISMMGVFPVTAASLPYSSTGVT